MTAISRAIAAAQAAIDDFVDGGGDAGPDPTLYVDLAVAAALTEFLDPTDDDVRAAVAESLTTVSTPLNLTGGAVSMAANPDTHEAQATAALEALLEMV